MVILAIGKYSLSNLEKDVMNQPCNAVKFLAKNAHWKDEVSMCVARFKMRKILCPPRLQSASL